MPNEVQADASNDIDTSFLGGDENVVDEAILDDMPDDGTFGETPDEKPQDGEATEDKQEGESEEKSEGEPTKEEGKQEDVDWKSRAEKNERIAREMQSRYDTLTRQIQPYAGKLAEVIRADQEKAEKMSKDRDLLLREFANDPAGVINTLMNNQLQNIRTQEQMAQIQVEAQNAYYELTEYAGSKGLDQANLAVLLAPYGNFANLHPKQALELAKVVVDKAAAPQINKQTTQEILKATDATNKQKLVKKTPIGHAGGSVQGREKSEEDKAWDRIRSSGPQNPLKSLR